MDNLSGIFPATVSTFDMDGRFDPSSMRRIVRHQIDAGVNGLYDCGGTGEGLLMNSKERQDLLETVLDETRGDVTVIAHVGAFQIPETMEKVEEKGNFKNGISTYKTKLFLNRKGQNAFQPTKTYEFVNRKG